MNHLKIHKSFKLNGESFSSVKELLSFSKTISESAFLFLSDWFSESDFVEVQTSGSTGIPILIKLQKEYMINSALATGLFFDVQEHTKALLCLPVDYIAGKMMLVRALILGWEIDFIEPSTNPLKLVDKRYDFSAMVPLQLQNSLKKLHFVKKLIVGGGAVSIQLQEKLQTVNTAVFATYGMTETSTHIAIKKLNSISNNIEKSFYQLLPDVNISQDNRGCLLIDAPKVSKSKIVTNDIVRMLSNSQFEWLGRIDNVINSGGVKLHPEQIEMKLSTCILSRFFVAGISDDILGERLILIIEGKKDKIIKESIANLQTLLKFEIPKEIYFLDCFVETDTKKIQRKKTLSKIFH